MDLEIAGPAGRLEVSAWRSHETGEIDLKALTEFPSAWRRSTFGPSLAAALDRTPFGKGLRYLRLRFRADPPAGLEELGNPAGLSHRAGFILDPLPSLDWNRDSLPAVRPLTAIDESAFVGLCERIFAAEMLGDISGVGIAELATRLFRGEAVEGWTGYRGFLVGDPEASIGTFFIGPTGGARLSFGLAGLLPEVRRTRLALATAVAVERTLRDLGATALQFEIDCRNRRSLAMARRRGAVADYRVLVCRVERR